MYEVRSVASGDRSEMRESFLRCEIDVTGLVVGATPLHGGTKYPVLYVIALIQSGIGIPR